MADEVGGLLGERVEVGHPRLRSPDPAELQEGADDLLAAEDLLVDRLQVAREVLEGVDGLELRIARHLEQALRAEGDGGERGVDLVGHPRGELADVGQPRRLLHALLLLLDVVDVLQDHHRALKRAVGVLVGRGRHLLHTGKALEAHLLRAGFAIGQALPDRVRGAGARYSEQRRIGGPDDLADRKLEHAGQAQVRPHHRPVPVDQGHGVDDGIEGPLPLVLPLEEVLHEPQVGMLLGAGADEEGERGTGRTLGHLRRQARRFGGRGDDDSQPHLRV